jgi:ankyrin repeat protein
MDLKWKTELMEAFDKNDLPKIKKLTLETKDPEFYKSALHTSAASGKTEIVKVLLENGVDVNMLNGDATPLFTSLLNHEFKTADFLILSGADIENINNEGTSDLLYFFHSPREYQEQIKYLIKKGANIHLKNDCGEDAFFLSVMDENEHFMHYLFELGVDINTENKSGISAVELAANEAIFDEIIDFFIVHFELLNDKNKRIIQGLRLERLFS